MFIAIWKESQRQVQYGASKRGEDPLLNYFSPSPDNLARRGGYRG